MDITKEMFRYLDAKRHLWNTYYVDFMSSAKSLEEEFPICDFQQIDKLLFSTLVLHKLGKELKESKYIWGIDPFTYLRLVPMDWSGEIEISISDRKKTTGKLENSAFENHVVDMKGELRFDFIEFFDWNSYGYTSFPLYLVRIMKYGPNPEFEGRDALIYTRDAKVHFIEEG